MQPCYRHVLNYLSGNKWNFYKEMTDNIVDILLSKDTIYYNHYVIIDNQNQIIYSIAESFVRRYSNFYCNTSSSP